MKARPKILMVIDRPDWAFGYIASCLVEHLSEDFDFEVITLHERYLESNYDLIYFLNWAMYYDLKDCMVNKSKYITAIRSHKSWRNQDLREVLDVLTTKFGVVHVISKKLYENFAPFVNDLIFLDDGIDTKYFTPDKLSNLKNKDSLIVGWAGHSAEPSKNFRQLIKPLENIDGIRLVTCGYDTRQLDRAGMKRFYEDIDVYLCASSSEGNSNTVLEAASMAKAVVTTESGAATEYLKDGYSALIVQQELPHIIGSIFRLKNDPELLKMLGTNAQTAVRERYEWSVIADQYRSVFKKLLKKRYKTTATPLAKKVIHAGKLKDPGVHMLEELPSILDQRNQELANLRTEINELKKVKTVRQRLGAIRRRIKI